MAKAKRAKAKAKAKKMPAKKAAAPKRKVAPKAKAKAATRKAAKAGSRKAAAKPAPRKPAPKRKALAKRRAQVPAAAKTVARKAAAPAVVDPRRPAKAAPEAALLQDLIGWARAAGADAADAIYAEGIQLSVGQRLGKPERLERSEGHDLGLRVLVGTRQAIVSTTDHSPDSLKALARQAAAMARAVPEDPTCGLAEPAQLAKSWPDLDLDDGSEPSAETLRAWAMEAEDAARAVKGVTNSEGADAGWSRTRVLLAASNGFVGGYSRAGYSLSCSVIAGEGAGMETDYDWTAAVRAGDLDAPGKVGRTAGERAVRKLNPRKVKSGGYPVVYDKRVSGGLIGHLAGAINGRAIARGTSFLKDRMGEAVFAKGVTVSDDPHRRRGMGSRPFDAEGLPTRRMAVIDDGRLTTWFLDLAAARQLKLEPTGHAGRGPSGPPSPGSSNLTLEAGKASVKELIGDIRAGLLIEGLIGFGVNGVTGDYSRGANGWWIENGELAYPVSGVTVAGNLKDMFLALTPANDLEFRSSVNAPSVRIEGMTIAGE